MTEIAEKNRTDEETPTATKTEARQAVAPHEVRYMLGFGIAGVVVAFIVIYVVYVGFIAA